METKLIELRDAMTFIPALAIAIDGSDDTPRDNALLRRAGYGLHERMILLTRADGGRAHFDPYDWGDRTWQTAHRWLEENWDTVTSGDLVDVRVILGETDTPCESEAML